MSGAQILIVDDEPSIRRWLSSYLRQQNYSPTAVSSGEEALAWMLTRRPDLVLLDLIMPGIGGLETCGQIRARSSVPIVVLSVMSDEQDKVEALKTGADDYVTKPFGPEELLARIGVALRHGAGVASGTDPVYRCDDFVIDMGRRLVSLGGREIRLTATEYGLLRCLAARAGRTVTYATLLRELWGLDPNAGIQPVRYGMHQLRGKLGEDPLHPRYIFTETGIGYWLQSANDPAT